MKCRLLLTLPIAVALAVTARASVTLNVSAGKLYGPAGTMVCPDNGLLQLVAAGADGLFTAPSASAFIQGDDVLVRSFAMNSSTTGIPGVASEALIMNYGSLGIETGQRLALRWYPTLTPASAAPAAGTPYGQFSTSDVRDGSDIGWTLPADGWSGSLKILTLSVGGSSGESAGVASEVVAAVTGPAILHQPASVASVAGAPTTLTVSAAGSGLVYQWYRGGRAIAGATSATLPIATVEPSDAGIHDVVVSGAADTLSIPAVLGVIPPAGSRTAGAVFSRAEWQDIHHPKGNVYDQFLLTGAAGTFTAATGKIARISFLDASDSIVQVEMSGAGATTVLLDNPQGPMAPVLYNQAIQYMRGTPTVILAGADETTHLSIYSVGTLTNPGVTRSDVIYDGWARVAALGIASRNGALGGLHLGNVGFSASLGQTGIVAFDVTTFAQPPAVVHDITAIGDGQPYLCFGTAARVAIKIAGGDLAQPVGTAITVSGLEQVLMGAGQDSCGVGAAAQACSGELILVDGTEVTVPLVSGP